MEAEPGNDHGVKTLDTYFPVIFSQHLTCFFAQLLIAPAVFELYYEGPSAPYNSQHIGKQRYLLFRVEKTEVAEFGIIQFIYSGIDAADSVESIIVENYHLSVLRKLDIKLYAVSRFRSQVKSLERVFWD